MSTPDRSARVPYAPSVSMNSRCCVKTSASLPPTCSSVRRRRAVRRSRLAKPRSSTRAPTMSAPSSLVSRSCAPLRIAPCSRAPVRFASLRLAPCRLQPDRSAFDRSTRTSWLPRKSASRRSAWRSSELDSLAWAKRAPASEAPCNALRPCSVVERSSPPPTAAISRPSRKSARVRSQFSRHASRICTPRRSAPTSRASVRSARVRSAPNSVAPLRSAWRNEQRTSVAPVRSASHSRRPFRSVPERSWNFSIARRPPGLPARKASWRDSTTVSGSTSVGWPRSGRLTLMGGMRRTPGSAPHGSVSRPDRPLHVPGFAAVRSRRRQDARPFSGAGRKGNISCSIANES